MYAWWSELRFQNDQMVKVHFIYFLLLVISQVSLDSYINCKTLYAADPLSTVHANLDKPGKCDKCHSAKVPRSVDSNKCRDCHGDIDQRIRNTHGYHGRIGEDVGCDSCHREHLGRNYKIVQLNPNSFNHSFTGWPLKGEHQRINCRKCHIERSKSGRESYLNPSDGCKSCHGYALRKNLTSIDHPHIIFWKPVLEGEGRTQQSIVRRVVMSREGAYHNCYERQLVIENLKLSGKVTFKFSISSQGMILFVKTQTSSLNNKNVEQCIERHLNKLRFPRPINGKPVTVRYTMQFKLGSGLR